MPINSQMSEAEFEECTAAAVELFDRLAASDAQLILAVDDGSGVLGLAATDAGPATVAELDQLLAGDRQFAALATRVRWSSTAAGASSDAWVFAAVTPARHPIVAVRRIRQDELWWRLDPAQAPWFALSTASALRRALRDGTPLQLKTAVREALFRRPDQVANPPVDADGRL